MTPLQTAIEKVHASGTAGVPFASFTLEEQEYLTGGLVPLPGQPFAPEIRALLGQYVLVVSDAAWETIHAMTAHLPHRIAAAVLVDGSRTIGADLLTWCGDSDPFGPLRPLLHTLPIRFVQAADFPPPRAFGTP